MLESLAFALAKTLITFMFEQHLENMQSIRLEGAPRWYAQQTQDHICDSGHSYGRLDSVDDAKRSARRQMELRLQRAMEIVSYEKFRDRTEPTERALIEGFSRDQNLPTFVESTLIYENIEYKEKQMIAYVRICIPKDRLQQYQEERVIKLVKAVTLHRRDKAMGELDAEAPSPMPR